MRAALRAEVGDALTSEIVDVFPVSGGCISEAFRCRLKDGRDVFV